MNEKAFTLTELLAVIVILGVLIGIAVPTYNNQINKARKKVYESYVSKVEDAAKTFVERCISKNVCNNKNNPNKDISFYENNANGIKIKDLLDSGYIDKLDDPKGGSACDGTVYLSTEYHNTTYEYKYKVCLKCNNNFKSEGCD